MSDLPSISPTAADSEPSEAETNPRHRVLDTPIVFWSIYGVAIVTITLSLSLSSPSSISPVTKLLGGIALSIGLLPCGFYILRRERRPPFFELICVVYSLTFILPLWLLNSEKDPLGWVFHNPSILDRALAFAGLGILSMTAGYTLSRRSRISLGRSLAPWTLDERRGRIAGFLIVFLGLARLTLAIQGRSALLGPLAHPIELLANLNLGLAVLWVLKLRSPPAFWFRTSVVGLTVLAVGFGLAQGSLHTALTPILVVLVFQWRYRGRLPWKVIAAALVVYSLAQPFKWEYRQRIWTQAEGAGNPIARLKIFAQEFERYWLQGGFQDRTEEATSEAWQRVSGLSLLGLVVEQTPATIEYQMGRTYEYLLVGWIPRLFWPNKPAAQQANDWFARSYGLLPEEMIGSTMIGMHQLTETYVNFGIFGLIFGMGLLGALYRWFESAFGDFRAGDCGQIVLMMLLVGFINIETNLAGTLGGVVQAIIVNLTLLSFAKKHPAST